MNPANLIELKTLGSTFGGYFAIAGVTTGTYALTGGLLLAVQRDLFESLGTPTDTRERLSRQQAGIAVGVYRVLLKRLPPAQALAAMAPLIEAGALAFLMKTLPEVSAETLSEGPAQTRGARVQAWMDRFFTAESHVTEVTADQVILHVTGCSLVRLVHAAGHPELGPLFCKGDLTFFQQRGIALTRPTRIAAGDAVCRFELKRT